jgi:hypothetical protein
VSSIGDIYKRNYFFPGFHYNSLTTFTRRNLERQFEKSTQLINMVEILASDNKLITSQYNNNNNNLPWSLVFCFLD